MGAFSLIVVINLLNRYNMALKESLTGRNDFLHQLGILCRSCYSRKFSQNQYDLIGPKYPGNSNVRQVKFRQSKNESETEKRYREFREQTEKWHIDYWEAHNTDFLNAKKVFIAETVLTKQQNSDGDKSDTTNELSAEEMSVFYKEYLLKTQSKHLAYNKEWYKKNFYIVYLAVMFNFSKLRNKFC